MDTMKKIKDTEDQTYIGRLLLEDDSVFEGTFFGFPRSIAGEVVFNTGMIGYPETMTDPSYCGQILTLTYPLIGNYGVPSSEGQSSLTKHFESDRIQISGLIVSDYSEEYSHWYSRESLSDWMMKNKVPGLYGIDTRALTKKLREKGTLLGKIELESETVPYYDPNLDNLMNQVSIDKPKTFGEGKIRVALFDCGCKTNIIHSLLKRGVQVKRVPWDYDLKNEKFDALVISNGPGDPKMCRQTILQVREVMTRDIPVFGICLGNQLLALAAGANTYKLKYGHRSQNQPVIDLTTNRCLVTSQNHGFAVDNSSLPEGWEPWFVNLNDNTNEGIRHMTGRFRSVQFHPEASPGPVDADYLFDEFLKEIKT
jgi:carbamoyl-phosphate synthase small subunit